MQLVVNLDTVEVESQMLDLAHLNLLEQLLCFDPWNRHSTIWRTILLKHDGG